MDAHRSPLLLLVQANVETEHEEAFNAWYYHHVPRLLEMPGYLWGRRYINVVGDVRYLALYKIEDAAYLESLLGPDAARRDRRASAEWEKFDALEGLADITTNVYEQISGTHLAGTLLRGEYPLSVVMADCVVPEEEAAFNDWYDQSHVPNLVKIPGYVSGARFRTLNHPAVQWLNNAPRYLALYEIESLERLPSLADPDTMRPEARAELERWTSYGAPLVENMSWNVFRPIATHHPFVD